MTNCNDCKQNTIYECAGTIQSNECVGEELMVVCISAPKIAQIVQPGQFVHLGIPGMNDHILRRPFSVYSADAKAGTIDILYQLVGHGTRKMSQVSENDEFSVMGPIGHGWQVPAGVQRVLLVGGGVGAAPLYMLCEKCIEAGIDTTVVLGAATHNKLATRARFADLLGCEPMCATDDGTFGHAGFCTELSAELLGAGDASETSGTTDATKHSQFDWVACCGPAPVMKIVAGQAQKADVACSVSMEEHMACGVGACLGCIVKTKGGNKRACVDGPVFDAQDIVWE